MLLRVRFRLPLVEQLALDERHLAARIHARPGFAPRPGRCALFSPAMNQDAFAGIQALMNFTGRQLAIHARSVRPGHPRPGSSRIHFIPIRIPTCPRSGTCSNSNSCGSISEMTVLAPQFRITLRSSSRSRSQPYSGSFLPGQGPDPVAPHVPQSVLRRSARVMIGWFAIWSKNS